MATMATQRVVGNRQSVHTTRRLNNQKQLNNLSDAELAGYPEELDILGKCLSARSVQRTDRNPRENRERKVQEIRKKKTGLRKKFGEIRNSSLCRGFLLIF